MSEPQTGRVALFGGGVAAILASTCCLGPQVRTTYRFIFWVVALLVLVALVFP